MAKKAMRSKPRKKWQSARVDALQQERQLLERSVRQQKRIRELSKQLLTATAAADAALRQVGRMVFERETPVERNVDEREPAEV